jgi:hypothetical protein
MEEVGQKGSKQFVLSHGTAHIRPMLNFEVNGYGETIVFRAADTASDPWLRQVLVTTCVCASSAARSRFSTTIACCFRRGSTYWCDHRARLTAVCLYLPYQRQSH